MNLTYLCCKVTSNTSISGYVRYHAFFILKKQELMNEKIHIGNLIRQKLKERERSATWLGKKIGCSRSGVCKMLKQDHIHTVFLLNISYVLESDFFVHYSIWLSENRKKVQENGQVWKNFNILFPKFQQKSNLVMKNTFIFVAF